MTWSVTCPLVSLHALMLSDGLFTLSVSLFSEIQLASLDHHPDPDIQGE